MCTCLVIASSMLNSSSKPRFLISSSRVVAIFMCVSSVALRAVSSGKAVMAVLRCAAFAERSLCRSQQSHSFMVAEALTLEQCR